MIVDPEPTIPSDPSTSKSADRPAKDAEIVKDLEMPDANSVKGGAVNAYLYVDGPSGPSTSKAD